MRKHVGDGRMLLAVVLGSEKFGTIFPHIFHSFVLGAVVQTMINAQVRRHGSYQELVWRGCGQEVARRPAA